MRERVSWGRYAVSFVIHLGAPICFYFRLSERRLVNAMRRWLVRAGRSQTWLVNTLVWGSLITALAGGATSTLMTSKAILFVKRINPRVVFLNATSVSYLLNHGWIFLKRPFYTQHTNFSLFSQEIVAKRYFKDLNSLFWKKGFCF